jgi:hypothetical protein
VSFFLACAVAGGALLILQFVASLTGLVGDGFGASADLPDDSSHAAPHGALHDLPHELADHRSHQSRLVRRLRLVSLRGLAAGLAFFGLAGEAAHRAGLPWLLAAAAGALAGIAAERFVALALRAMVRAEHDGSVRLDNALGQDAQVYVPIPADGQTAGKVMMTLQGRTVEIVAVQPPPAADQPGAVLPTGSRVRVVDVLGPNLVRVAPITSLMELEDALS